MPKILEDLTVIRDSRENKGWNWESEEKQPGKYRIAGTVEKCLDAGDYSIAGYEDVVRIERKAGFGELFGNMLPREHKERFEREMEKLRGIPYKYLLIESYVNNDMMGMSVPQIWKGPPTSAVMKWIFELQMEFGIVPMFVGDCGKRIAKMIFENVVRKTNR